MIYLDYAATCPVVKYPSSAYGPFLNPNANYAYKEKRLLSEAENRVKKAIGAKGGKVIFGGTSSQLIENLMNTIERDPFYSHYCVGSCFEHDSCDRFLTNKCDTINEFETFLQDHRGFRTVAMWMGVNNLTGEIFPIEKIGGLCHKYLDAFYICDATALVGHAPIPKNIDNWCSAFIIDGHKLGTELGIGCCWISDKLDKWLNGFKLHGTPNLAGALAIADATEDAISNVKDNVHHWVDLYCYLKKELEENGIEYSVVIGGAEWGKWTPAINAIRLPEFNADALQQYLASKQIYVSIGGSACAEKHDYRVLNVYGLSNDEASEVIRVSFGEDSSVEDVETLVEGIKNFKELYLK
nr:MAG TPA: cysteine sulfinate desulfinase/cysteine desulfurase [Caudoviricetes sp.]